MRLVWTLVWALASCTTAQPTPDTGAPETEPTVPAPVPEPVKAAEAPVEVVREPPDMTGDFEGLEASAPEDLGDGWAAFGVHPKSGVIRAAWYPDGEDPVIADAVATHEDLEWCRELTTWASKIGPYAVFYVSCMSGEDNITSESTGYVFDLPATTDPLRPVWSGLVSYENSNQVSGCTEGDNGALEIRGEDLWLVTDVWSEQMEGYEEEAEDFGPCDGPDVAAERQLTGTGTGRETETAP